MPKYRVSMQELVFYSVYVEADSEDEAEIKAEAKFLAGDYTTDGIDDRSITDVEITDVELARHDHGMD